MTNYEIIYDYLDNGRRNASIIIDANNIMDAFYNFAKFSSYIEIHSITKVVF